MTKRLCLIVALTLSVDLHAVDLRHTIMSKNPARKTPIWVPAADSTDAAGRLNAAEFEPHQNPARPAPKSASAAQTANAADSPCAGVAVYEDFGLPGTPRSIRALSRKSNFVVAKVVDSTPGFFEGQPATLLRLSESESSSAADIFAVYPAANFQVDHQVRCRFDPRYPKDIPAVGDQVLLFPSSASDRDGKVFAPAPTELIFEHEGRLRYASALQSDPDIASSRSLSDVARRAREAREGMAR